MRRAAVVAALVAFVRIPGALLLVTASEVTTGSGSSSDTCSSGLDGPGTSACRDADLFDRLLNRVQAGIDTFVPPDERSGLAPLAELIALDSSGAGGRTLVARRDIRAGELLVRIPMQMLIHAGYYKPSAEPAPGTRKSAEGVGQALVSALNRSMHGRELEIFIAPHTWLALYMLEHRQLGATSPWHQYLEFLPHSFPTIPVFYTDNEWKWLEGSQFINRASKHKESLRSQYQRLEELLPNFNATHSFNDFLWARSVISSRVFGWRLPGLPAKDTDFMVPFGDMFNHRSPKQIEWLFNATVNTLDYTAKEDIAVGSEMFISYGAKCNSEYLLHYGFAEPNVSRRLPPVSTVRVTMDLDFEVPDRDAREKWLLKRRLMENAARLPPEVFDLKAASFKDAGAGNMLGYARVLSLPGGGDFDHKVRSGRSCRPFMTPPRCDQPMGLETERAALRRCASALTQALRRYPTSVDHDEKLLPTLSGLPRMLATLRRDEKLVLEHFRGFFEFALEASDWPVEEIENRSIEKYGRFSAEGRYLRVALSAVVAFERASR